MKYTIELNCNALRALLNEDEKKRYDDMTDYFIDHRYDEDNPIEELMLNWVSQNYPVKYMQFIRQQVTQQNVVYSKFDAKLRVELELLELNEKLSKLRQAIFPTPNEVLAKLPKAVQHLCEQENTMTHYQVILQTRLKEMQHVK